MGLSIGEGDAPRAEEHLERRGAAFAGIGAENELALASLTGGGLRR